MFRMRPIVLLAIFAVITALACPVGALAQDKPKPRILTLATATKGGTFYPMGQAMAKLWNDRLEKLNIYCKVMETGGSRQNLGLMGDKAQLAIIQGMFAKMAWQGLSLYQDDQKRNLRALCMLWPNVEHFVIAGDKVKSGTPLDIKGAKFVLGKENSGSALSALEIMRGLGLTEADITPLYIGYGQAADAFIKGKAQGANLPSGPPCAAVIKIFESAKHKPVILQFSEAQLAAINHTTFYPAFRYVLPAGTYPGQDKDVHTIAQPTLLVCDASLPADIAYGMVKVLMTHEWYLKQAHPMGRFIGLNNALRGLPVPLHNGAMRYYQEQGIILPQSHRAQAEAAQ